MKPNKTKNAYDCCDLESYADTCVTEVLPCYHAIKQMASQQQPVKLPDERSRETSVPDVPGL